jgi:hypothetical protein
MPGVAMCSHHSSTRDSKTTDSALLISDRTGPVQAQPFCFSTESEQAVAQLEESEEAGNVVSLQNLKLWVVVIIF